MFWKDYSKSFSVRFAFWLAFKNKNKSSFYKNFKSKISNFFWASMSFSLGVNLEALSLTKRVQKYTIRLQNPNAIRLILNNISDYIHKGLSIAKLRLKLFFVIFQRHNNTHQNVPY